MQENQQQDLVQDINSELNVEYASLGLRFIAYFLDVFILLVPLIIIEELVFDKPSETGFSMQRNLLGLFVWTVYYGLTESSEGQATLGKRIMGLKVIDIHGNKLTFKKAALRYLAQIISIVPIGFGIWSIATDEKKQAWHDMLLDCFVIMNKTKNLESLDSDISK